MLSAQTESEWLDHLSLIFGQLSNYFIIVKAQDVFKFLEQDNQQEEAFLNIFQVLVDRAVDTGTVLKALVVTYGSASITGLQSIGSSGKVVYSVQKSAPVPPHLRRPHHRNSTRSAIHQRFNKED